MPGRPSPYGCLCLCFTACVGTGAALLVDKVRRVGGLRGLCPLLASSDPRGLGRAVRAAHVRLRGCLFINYVMSIFAAIFVEPPDPSRAMRLV